MLRRHPVLLCVDRLSILVGSRVVGFPKDVSNTGRRKPFEVLLFGLSPVPSCDGIVLPQQQLHLSPPVTGFHGHNLDRLPINRLHAPDKFWVL